MSNETLPFENNNSKNKKFERSVSVSLASDTDTKSMDGDKPDMARLDN